MSNTYVTACFAQGAPLGTNVYVSGGGLHVQASSSLVLQKCAFTECSIRDVSSEFIQSGGRALGTLNVSNISSSASYFLSGCSAHLSLFWNAHNKGDITSAHHRCVGLVGTCEGK
jgi:hypothetical protein